MNNPLFKICNFIGVFKMKNFKFYQVSYICLLLVTILGFYSACKNENPVGSKGTKSIAWQQTSLDSLRITSLTAHSEAGILASSCGSPIFRTVDSGKTWTSVHPNTCAYALAINAVGDIFYLSGNGFGRSTDETASWTYKVVPFRSDIRAITFTNNHDIFLGSSWSDETPGGILRSSDNGDTWSRTSFPDSISGRILISLNDYVFVGTSFGVYRSSDNGETWELMNTGFRKVFKY